MTYIESNLEFYVRTRADFPLMFDSSLKRTLEFISNSVNLEAKISVGSSISFDLSDWRIGKVVRETEAREHSERAAATIVWTIEAIISHPSQMTPSEILQEIDWVVVPNTVWDDEIEVSVLSSELI